MPSHEFEEPPSLTQPVRGIVLAAGKGTRMRSNLPKVLHLLRGLPIIEHSLRSVLQATGNKPLIVVGQDAAAVRAAVGERADFAVQSEQLGTGHAVMQAEAALRGDPAQQFIITAADMPLVRAETLRHIAAERERSGAAIVMLTVVVNDPRGFGRVVRDAGGNVSAIVEEVACSPAQLKVNELNGAIYCVEAAWLWGALRRIQPNPRKGEYFLTDLVEIAVADGRTVRAIVGADVDECIGINTRVDLADADAALRRRINRAHMLNGVSIVDPATTYIDLDVTIGADTTILPNTHLLGRTRIGSVSVIGPDALLRDSVVGDGCEVCQSVLEEAQVDDGGGVGPFSHLREGAYVGQHAHVGNFGEMKKSRLGARSKMGHFSYLGDATVGEGVNIGAGAITCNYDGVRKNPTIIGDGAFIGSDTLLVAPVEVGANATTGAGAVVTKNVPPDSVAVGLPARVIRRKPPKSSDV
ncbi:MAG: bifunctional UDP-N-acetylglucosamine diphosphorylase/glucosamine-1-phosphate N-acetyltransferase GlmU [Chloroflexi bacterium]|nr:bifunctional UDP-N-acetylglucosamine diphosphorylase/glucosamine-1-phosphate N-acetyltransferase GlmU [Chloroflexota bacterium]MCL5273122.1 bifunctional UDP-N-acetylglucosamine diphosphorylase/glucosamine-1-phosphate N-acetyltransferase GlmU [Chloroflexota bacterium]